MLSTIINIDRYPLDRPESDEYRSIVRTLSTTLKAENILNIPGFLTAEAVERITKEIDARTPFAYHSERMGTPYGITQPNDFPDDHPYNIKSHSNRFGLGRHQLLNTRLDEIYQLACVKKFVGDILGLDTIHWHEDPANALVVQIYKTHGCLAWHFDRAHFSTVLNIREPEQGGFLECVPALRNDDDPCFDDVQDVLLDRSEKVRRCGSTAGSFTIMYGRNTLHRVTSVTGKTARISVVLSYENRPGVKLDYNTRKLFFGNDVPEQ